MSRLMAVAFLCLVAAQCLAAEPKELFRIRVENSAGGRVQVSIDSGKTFLTVGRVRRSAVAYYTGFAASAYVPDGSVAATAVHGVRLKVGTLVSDKKRIPLTISLVPSEFDETPDGYGGHIPYGSGIYTDIPSGTAIFRNFAPFVGSSIMIETAGGPTKLPNAWKPVEGAVLVIISSLPQPYLKTLEIENRRGGAVTAEYDDGKSQRIATVTCPLKGIGRFDGTSYTGVGLINTNHGGVLTISTAPIATSKLLEGKGPERRGGFEIQPSAHAKTQCPMPQAIVVEPAEGGAPLEGRAPIYSGFIGLAYDPAHPECSIRAEVSSADGTWGPMPQVVGKLDNAIVKMGIRRFRILFPRYDVAFLKRSLAESRKRVTNAESQARGIVTIRPTKQPDIGSIVTILIDGTSRSTSSQPPYQYSWNTRSVSNGDHEIEIRISNANGQTILSEKRMMDVENR